MIFFNAERELKIKSIKTFKIQTIIIPKRVLSTLKELLLYTKKQHSKVLSTIPIISALLVQVASGSGTKNNFTPKV